MDKIEKILIVKLGAVGDCVHTLYALAALRSAFPNAFIGWAVEDKAFKVIEGHPSLNAVHLIRRKQGLAQWIKSAGEIGKIGYDVAIDLSNLLKSGFVTWKSGAPLRIGADRLREGNFLFTNRRVQAGKGHMIERYFRLLSPLGDFSIPEKAGIFVTEKDKRIVDDFFAQNLPGDGPVVALNPHGAWPNKLYPVSKYAEAADRVAKTGARILLVWGGEKEKRVVESMAEMMSEKAVIALPTDLKQLYHLLSGSTLYLGNDTGPMHMAALAGAGVVAVFGPTNPERVRPWTDKAVALTPQDQCEKWPCEKRKCRRPHCIDAIDPRAVADAAIRMLGGQA